MLRLIRRQAVAAGIVAGTVVGLAACGGSAPLTPLPAFAHPALAAAAFKEHVSALAHDSMQGRAPGTEGGRLAEAYLESAFAQAGLRKAPGLATFRQRVPLRATRVDHATLVVTLTDALGQPQPIAASELAMRSAVGTENVAADAPLVFVGHALSAPDAGWDDLGDRPLQGRIAVVLPGVPTGLAQALPGGPGSYLGETDAKEAQLERLGASGMVVLTPPGGERGFASDRSGAMGFPYLLPAHDDARLPFQGRLSPDASAKLLTSWGLTWEEAIARPAPLLSASLPELRLALSFSSTETRLAADNVVGLVKGRRDEFVVVTAHFDAYGIGPADSRGDSIYNGATDNAAGTAALIELARAVASAPQPERGVLFVATTAEEGGAFGARHFLDASPVPLSAIVVNVNLDGVGFLPPTNGFTVFPVEGTTAVPLVTQIAEPLGLAFRPEGWHAGMHFSFDTAEFLMRGIGALTVWQSGEVQPEFAGASLTSGPTHSPRDEYFPDWSDAGIEQHLGFYRTILDHFVGGGAVPAVDPAGAFRQAGRLLRR